MARIGEPITFAALLPRGPLVVFVQVARNANPIQVIVIIAMPAPASWFEMVNAKGLSAADCLFVNAAISATIAEVLAKIRLGAPIAKSSVHHRRHLLSANTRRRFQPHVNSLNSRSLLMGFLKRPYPLLIGHGGMRTNELYQRLSGFRVVK